MKGGAAVAATVAITDGCTPKHKHAHTHTHSLPLSSRIWLEIQTNLSALLPASAVLRCASKGTEASFTVHRHVTSILRKGRRNAADIYRHTHAPVRRPKKEKQNALLLVSP